MFLNLNDIYNSYKGFENNLISQWIDDFVSFVYQNELKNENLDTYTHSGLFI